MQVRPSLLSGESESFLLEDVSQVVALFFCGIIVFIGWFPSFSL